MNQEGNKTLFYAFMAIVITITLSILLMGCENNDVCPSFPRGAYQDLDQNTWEFTREDFTLYRSDISEHYVFSRYDCEVKATRVTRTDVLGINTDMYHSNL
jgi:major membrane immunogen (membrane-anchored lipoprotein)